VAFANQGCGERERPEMLRKQMSFIVGIATCVSFGTLMPPQSRGDVVVDRRIQLESGCEKR